MVSGKYNKCIELARWSACEKRGFGCLLVTHDGRCIAETYNGFIGCAHRLCVDGCTRLKMPSGVDPLISGCGHAEELAIWKAIEWVGFEALTAATLYVAGVSKPDNKPLELDSPYFYCLRCATTMYYAGIKGVNVFVKDEWVFMTTQEAYDSSLKFAMGEATTP